MLTIYMEYWNLQRKWVKFGFKIIQCEILIKKKIKISLLTPTLLPQQPRPVIH